MTMNTERFWSKVDRRGDDECWPWKASRIWNGYGQFSAGGRGGGMLLAHRVMYELHCGPIPPGLCVCHTCDVRDCVNPRHLFLGTKRDNTRDMMQKGRQRLPDPRGEANGRAKVTTAQVREIRALYATGEHTEQAIAARYGLSRSHAGNIARGATWSHVA